MLCRISGHFGEGKTLLNGQTVKTKIFTEEMERKFGKSEICRIDTHGGLKRVPGMIMDTIKAFRQCDNMVMLPAYRGLRLMAPLFAALKKIYKKHTYYFVIGGWLADYLKNNTGLLKNLSTFDRIYVESDVMKNDLQSLGLTNVEQLPNFKNCSIVKENEISGKENKPFRLATFSRVMAEKGIEEAVEGVKLANERLGDTVFFLTIYGQIEPDYKERFEQIKSVFPEYINYGGKVPYDKSTEMLKKCVGLLFPTRYSGEGFAGTLIDAFAAGVPVIATDWNYNSEIVRDGYNGFMMDGFEAPDVADQLIRLYKLAVLDPAKFKEMRINCIHEAENYLPENVLKNFEEHIGGNV